MNIGGIIFSVISYMVVGFFWYSPYLFGNMWAKITGMSADKVDKEKMIIIFGLSAFGAVVTAIILNYLMIEFEVQTLNQALFLAFLLSFGFALPPIMVNNLYQRKNKALIFIDGGYQIVTVFIMSIILYLL